MKTLTLHWAGRRRTVCVIKSEDKRKTDREYTIHALAEAAAWGHSVDFHLRDGNPKEVFRCARYAARWAMKVVNTWEPESEIERARRLPLKTGR